MSRAGRDEGAFPVFEAVLVALFVFSAMLFLSVLQRPTADPSGQGTDLGRMAQQSLDILEHRNITLAGQVYETDEWLSLLLQDDAGAAREVDEFMRDFLSPGVNYAIRIDNGIDTIPLLPADGPSTPVAARVARTVVVANWTELSTQTMEFTVAPGQALPAALGDPCDGSNDWTDLRPPINRTAAPGGTWSSWWCDNVDPDLPGHVPAAAPLGPWRYADGDCPTANCHFLVGLDGSASRHPLIGLQLVLWHAA